MNREGFTLVEVILLIFFIGILLIPASSLLNTTIEMRSKAGKLHGEVNGVREMIERIYYEEPVELLRGVEYEQGDLTLKALAMENIDIREEREARKRRGENLYEYRRLDIDVEIYLDQKLKGEFQIYRVGLLTEGEREYYDRMGDLHGK